MVRHPPVWVLNDIMNDEHFSNIMRMAILRLAKSCADHVVVNSRAPAAAIIGAGLPEDRIRVIYPSIDTRSGEAEDDASRVSRPHGASACGWAAAIWLRGKGQHVLLEAIKSMPGLDAWIVGAALFGEADYEQRLRAIAAAPEFAGRVKFLGYRADVLRLMRVVQRRRPHLDRCGTLAK